MVPILFEILEIGLMFIIGLFAVTQVIVPIIKGKKLFPIFQKR